MTLFQALIGMDEGEQFIDHLGGSLKTVNLTALKH